MEVPALMCESWSDYGIHTRGSLEGFQRIGSAQKWLYTHGGRKWHTFYSPEARELQRRFFDRFLKGEANGFGQTPRVQLAVRRSLDESDIRTEPDWPLARIAYVPLYLAGPTALLRTEPAVAE